MHVWRSLTRILQQHLKSARQYANRVDKRPDILRFGSDGWQARYDKSFTRDNVVRLAEAPWYCWSQELPGGIVFVGF